MIIWLPVAEYIAQSEVCCKYVARTLKCYIQRIIRFERYLKCLLVQSLFWGWKHTNPDKWLSSLGLNTSSYCASTTPGGSLLSAQSSHSQEIPSFEFGSPSVKLPPNISCLTLRSYEEWIYTFLLVTGFQELEDWYFISPYLLENYVYY